MFLFVPRGRVPGFLSFSSPPAPCRKSAAVLPPVQRCCGDAARKACKRLMKTCRSWLFPQSKCTPCSGRSSDHCKELFVRSSVTILFPVPLASCYSDGTPSLSPISAMGSAADRDDTESKMENRCHMPFHALHGEIWPVLFRPFPQSHSYATCNEFTALWSAWCAKAVTLSSQMYD